MDTYVKDVNFIGLFIKWDKFLKFELKHSGTSYTSTCFPVYDSTDNAKTNANSDTINFNPAQQNWGFLRCSVDIPNKLYFHHDEENIVTEKTLLGTNADVADAATTLKFENNDDSVTNANNKRLANSGVAFIRQVRLWTCYLCQDADTYRFDLTSASRPLYPKLKHIYEAPFPTDATFNTANLKINDILPDTPGTTSVLPESQDWLGYNSLNSATYKRLDKVATNNGNAWLCSEWRDVCTGLVYFFSCSLKAHVINLYIMALSCLV